MKEKDEDIFESKVSWKKIVSEYVSSMTIYKNIIKNLAGLQVIQDKQGHGWITKSAWVTTF